MSTVEETQAASASRADAIRALISKHLRLLSAVAFVLGVAGLLVSELGNVHQLRVFAAGLISVAGIGFGIDTGLADPRTLRVPAWLHSRRAAIGIISTVVVIAPAALALVALLAGIAGDAGTDRDTLLLILGVLIGALMLAATLLTGGLTVVRIARAAREEPNPGDPTMLDGEGAEA